MTAAVHDDQASTPDAPPTRRRRVRSAVRRHPVVAAALGVAALLLLAGLVPLALAAVPMMSGRDAAVRGRQALLDGDLPVARDALAEAEGEFRLARYALRNPIATIGGIVPGVGHNVRTAGALARAGELTAGAGAIALEAVTDLPGGVAALSPSGGALPVDRVAQLADPLAEAAQRIVQARELVDVSPTLLLAGPVAEARGVLADQLAGAGPAAEAAAALAEALPPFLGSQGERRYFFGASNPAELRGTGGYIGAYAVLTVTQGRLSFSEFGALSDLPPTGAVDPPTADYAARYDRYSRAEDPWNTVNLSPDFPSAALVIERLWAESFGEELDGVIVADPFALSALMDVAGPTAVPGFGTVDAEGVVPFVANEAYGEFENPDVRKAVLGAVAAAALQGFLAEGGGEPTEVLLALGGAVAGGHLQLHAADPSLQAALETAGIAGALPAGSGDALVVAANSSTNAKVDYYLEADVRYDVRLGADGSATARATIELENAAPARGESRYVIGPNLDDLDAGDNRLFVSVFGGPHGEIEGFSRDGVRSQARIERELTLPVLTTQVELASGERQTLVVSTSTPAAWTGDAGRLTYHLATRVPPLVAGIDLTVVIEVPEGMDAVDLPEGANLQDDTVLLDVITRGTTQLAVTFQRPMHERVWSAVQDFLSRPAFTLQW